MQSAASKAAQTGVTAETQYDLARAEAKRVYNNAVQTAEVARTTAFAAADKELTLAPPWWVGPTSTWWGEPDGLAALAAHAAARDLAQADYDAAVKAARVRHAEMIGDAQIARATLLETPSSPKPPKRLRPKTNTSPTRTPTRRPTSSK